MKFLAAITTASLLILSPVSSASALPAPPSIATSQDSQPAVPANDPAPAITTSSSSSSSSFSPSSLLRHRRRSTGVTSNELLDGPCRALTLIFARGTTEPGNMGDSPGPRLCDGLKAHYGGDKVACQGIDGPYKAQLGPNLLPKGSTDEAFAEGARLFALASTRCPASRVVAGGFSQGGAVVHGAVALLAPDVLGRIAGVVTFGDSQLAEDGGVIPALAPYRFKGFCNFGDIICWGGLLVTPAHLDYNRRVPQGTAFLVSLVGDL